MNVKSVNVPQAESTDKGTRVKDAWFVAQLKPGGLNRAMLHLKRQGFTTFCPAQRVGHLASARNPDRRRPLFSGYLFVSFDPDEPGWAAINNTRGVARLVLNDPRDPAPLPGTLIAGLMARCDATGLLLAPENLDAGDRIRVLAGPFAEYVTRIEEMKEGDRIGVLIDLLGRQVRTALPRSDVEKLG